MGYLSLNIIVTSLVTLVANVSAVLPDILSQNNTFKSFLEVNNVDQEDLICNKALCKSTDSINRNTSSYCYKYKLCSKCSVSNVPDHPVCYLLDNDHNYIHLMEGHLGSQPIGSANSHDNSSHDEHSSHSNNGDMMDEHEEENFLQEYESKSMKFIPTSNMSDFDHARRSCAVDSKGNVMISVRLIIQWYMSKDKSNNQQHHGNDDDSQNYDANYLQLTPMYSDDSVNSSMLEMDHDDSESSNSHKSRMANMAKNFQVLKNIHKSAVKRYKSPKAKIYLIFSNPKINSCRHPVIYNGKISPSSMFVAKLESTISQIDLTQDLIKSSIETIVSCEACDKLKYNSCIQVTCAKNTPGAASLAMGSAVYVPMTNTTIGVNAHNPNAVVAAGIPMGKIPVIPHPAAISGGNVGHLNNGLHKAVNNAVMMPNGTSLPVQSGVVIKSLYNCLAFLLTILYLNF